jgi:DNA-binding MarR family transcriptional regulator
MVSILPKYGRWANGFRDFDTPYGRIGFRQLAVLWAIRYNLVPDSDVSPSRLAALQEVQPSVMTRALAKLESNGFVVRATDPRDGRRSRIEVTRKGQHVSKFVEDLYVDDIVGSLSLLDDARVEELHRCIEALGSIVDDLETKRKDRLSRVTDSDGNEERAPDT